VGLPPGTGCFHRADASPGPSARVAETEPGYQSVPAARLCRAALFQPTTARRGVGQHPIAASKLSPSSMRARSSIANPRAMAASSDQATSNG
jgi:hypothetical protein